MFIARAMCGLTHVTVAALCSSCSLQKYLGTVTGSFVWSWTISVNVNVGTQDPENWTQYRSFVSALFTVNAQQTPVHLTWGLLQVFAACPTPRLNLKFELRPYLNNTHDVPHRDRAGYSTIHVLRLTQLYFKVILLLAATFDPQLTIIRPILTKKKKKTSSP